MKWKKIAAIAVLGLVGFVAFDWWKGAEPKHTGKPISYWLNELRAEDDRQQQGARAAFKEMGSGATQYLLNCLRSSDSYLRRTLSKWHVRVRSIDGSAAVELLPSGNLKRAMAATALSLVEPDLSAAIPVLSEAVEDKSSIVGSRAQAALIQLQKLPTTQLQAALSDINLAKGIKAASVLYPLGTNASWIASELTNGFRRASLQARYDGINYLCGNELDAAVAWPIILYCLDDRSLMTRGNALNAAIMQLAGASITTKWAAQAHAAIVACLSDSDVNVRGGAMIALSAFPLNAALVPAPILKGLVNDSNPSIRRWAEGVEKEISRSIPK